MSNKASSHVRLLDLFENNASDEEMAAKLGMSVERLKKALDTLQDRGLIAIRKNSSSPSGRSIVVLFDPC